MIRKKEEEKKSLFKQGVEETSQYQKLTFARKVNEVDGEIKDMGVRLTRISQRTLVINKIIDLKKNQAKHRENDPVWNTIAALSPSEIEGVLTTSQATVIEEDQKLGHILEILNVDSHEFTLEEDPETIRILRAMEDAGETSSISNDLNAVHAEASENCEGCEGNPL
jgi:hypothetical protein